MKRLLLALVVLTVRTVLAEEVPRITVTVLPSAPQPPSVLHGFGGKPVKMQVAIDAPLASRLDVEVTLHQLAQHLTARVAEGLPIAEGLEFDDRTRCVVDASIPLPEVERVTRFIGTLRVRPAGSDTWEKAGQTFFVAYPPGQLDPLKRSLATLAASESVRLGVFGESRKLRSFFKREKIPFLDLGDEFPAGPDPKVIHLGETSLEKLRGKLPESIQLIAFDPDPWRFDRNPETLPGVYASSRREGFIVEVTLNILHNIESDPLAQETFARILGQTIFQNRPF